MTGRKQLFLATSPKGSFLTVQASKDGFLSIKDKLMSGKNTNVDRNYQQAISSLMQRW